MLYLLINSSDRLSGSPSNFVMNLPNKISNVVAVKLKEVALNHKVFNISNEYNNARVSISEGMHNLVTFDLPDGHYTENELCTVLQDALTANSLFSFVYTVTYSPNTYSFTISSTGNFQLMGYAGIFTYLGFDFSNITPGFNLTYTTTNVSQFNNYPYILADFSCFPQNMITSNPSVKSTFKFSNVESQQEYNGLANQICSMAATDVQYFTVNLKNPDGTNVNLRGNDWWCLLEIQTQ